MNSAGNRFLVLLQSVFILLKLTKVINWSWVSVLIPFEVSVVVSVVYLLALIIVVYLFRK